MAIDHVGVKHTTKNWFARLAPLSFQFVCLLLASRSWKYTVVFIRTFVGLRMNCNVVTNNSVNSTNMDIDIYQVEQLNSPGHVSTLSMMIVASLSNLQAPAICCVAFSVPCVLPLLPCNANRVNIERQGKNTSKQGVLLSSGLVCNENLLQANKAF